MSASGGRAIGVDIGGTKIACSLVEDGRLVDPRTAATPAEDPAAILNTVRDLVDEVRPSSEELPVGVAAAGYLDRDREILLFAPNIAWRDLPLRARLGEVLGRPVIIENDANAAAWGEYRFGAGRGASTMAMVTVGTGIGGGIVTEGQLLLGGHGVAGEWGHLQVVSDQHPGGEPPRGCGCGSRGCWEMYGSGTALERTAQRQAATPAGAWLLERVDGDADRITGRVVSEAALEGVPMALELLAEIGRWLGEGLASVSAVLDPDVIVVGGGVAEVGDAVLTPLRLTYQGVMTHSHRPTAQIRSAALGNDAGMLGAADLALRRGQRE